MFHWLMMVVGLVLLALDLYVQRKTRHKSVLSFLVLFVLGCTLFFIGLFKL